ncbi:hypothetical protein BE20_00005 [Sorangium cellulosum]|nr:hypothetical protein BE20_00005 [Sorangium cellulosum]
MSRAPVDAPAETAAELPTLGTAALPALGRLSPAALAERTQIALFDATRLAAAFSLVHEELWIAAGADVLYIDRATVLRTALDMASFVLAHNHPSGDPARTKT